MASPILMPDLDMDSTAKAKEYAGPVDLSDVAATTRKRKTKKKKNLVRKGRVLPTQVQRHR